MGKFRSVFEKDFAHNCEERGVAFEYETEKIRWTPPQKTYTPDFIFEKHDGSLLFLETKGYLRPSDRVKLKAVMAQHPDLDLRIVFQNASNTITKASSSKTYAEWSKYIGIKWAEKTIPSEWVKEIRSQVKGKK